MKAVNLPVMSCLCQAMEVRNFRDSEVIVEEGAEGNEFFVIQKGSCKCYKKLLKF